jgi:hypothetical protein
VALLRLSRPTKANAIDEEMIAGIKSFFSAPTEGTRAVIAHGEGRHFSAPVKLGDEWYVLARHPSGQREHVRRFKSETEAKNWIARKSTAWLKKRGYADDWSRQTALKPQLTGSLIVTNTTGIERSTSATPPCSCRQPPG